jgi:hypothetical protein
MAATFNWCEDNGVLTSGHGTTRSQNATPPTDCSWKNVDDAKTAGSGTAYSASPIVAGNNSFTKYQYGQFSGTYNEILNCKWSANTAINGVGSGTLATGLTLHGKVTQTYTTPATSTDSGIGSPTNFTTVVPIASGSAVNLGADPSTAASATLAAGGGFTEYLATQLQTTTAAAAGDTLSVQSTLQYDEN